MTKGCLGALESARVEGTEAEEEEKRGEDEEAEEDRRPSRRKPEKWGPDAASITLSDQLIDVVSNGALSLSRISATFRALSLSLGVSSRWIGVGASKFWVFKDQKQTPIVAITTPTVLLHKFTATLPLVPSPMSSVSSFLYPLFYFSFYPTLFDVILFLLLIIFISLPLFIRALSTE